MHFRENAGYAYDQTCYTLLTRHTHVSCLGDRSLDVKKRRIRTEAKQKTSRLSLAGLITAINQSINYLLPVHDVEMGGLSSALESV